jgi:DNA-binding winged helix-turn-helix (wHTH) protein
MLYRFGSHEMNEITRELSRDGHPVAVEPKVFDLLGLLIRQRRRVVSREELARELWPGISVGPDSLSRLVKEARKAVGDCGERQATIRTLRGCGYRFVAEVRVREAGAASSEAERLLAYAQRSLETAVDVDSTGLRDHVHEFVASCRLAIESALEQGTQPLQ